jgi:hypothetical protein
MENIENNSDHLKEFEGKLNQSIETMASDLFSLFDDTYNEFNPELLDKYREMKLQIKNQKDENSSLLKQIDFLNQEVKIIFDNIIKLGVRLSDIEKIFGYDIHNQEKKFNETGFNSIQEY